MGDRVIFHVFDDEEIGPAVYGHWSGERYADVLKVLTERMDDCRGDVEYATARLIQILIGNDDSNLGFGCWNAPRGVSAQVWRKITDAEYSRGDAGVILIDCRDFKAFAHGGYAAKDNCDDDEDAETKAEHLDAPPKTWKNAVDRVK